MADVSDKRQPLPRADVTAKINLEFEKFSGFLQEYSQNVSEGGMFIRTGDLKPVGTIFSFEFKLKDDFVLIHGFGEVRWTREKEEGPDRPVGMGIKFIEIDNAGRQLIKKVVSNQAQPGADPTKPPNLQEEQVDKPTTSPWRQADPNPPTSPWTIPTSDAAEQPTDTAPAATTEPQPKVHQAPAVEGGDELLLPSDMSELNLPEMELNIQASQTPPPEIPEAAKAATQTPGPSAAAVTSETAEDTASLAADFLQNVMNVAAETSEPEPPAAAEAAPQPEPTPAPAVEPTEEIPAELELPPDGPALDPNTLASETLTDPAATAEPELQSEGLPEDGIGVMIDTSLLTDTVPQPAAEPPTSEEGLAAVEQTELYDKHAAAKKKKPPLAWIILGVIVLGLVAAGFLKREAISKYGRDVYLTLRFKAKHKDAKMPDFTKEQPPPQGKPDTLQIEEKAKLAEQAVATEDTGSIKRAAVAPQKAQVLAPAQAPASKPAKAVRPSPAKPRVASRATANLVNSIESATGGGATIISIEGNGPLNKARASVIEVPAGPKLVLKIIDINKSFRPAIINVSNSPHVMRLRSGWHADNSLHIVFDLKGKTIPAYSIFNDGTALLVQLGP